MQFQRDEITTLASEKIKGFDGNIAKTEIEPVAFGLKSLNIIFSMPEEKGDTEPLEKQISELPGVKSVQVTDVRRAIG